MDAIDEALLNGLSSTTLSGLPEIPLPADVIQAYQLLDYYYCYASLHRFPGGDNPEPFYGKIPLENSARFQLYERLSITGKRTVNRFIILYHLSKDMDFSVPFVIEVLGNPKEWKEYNLILSGTMQDYSKWLSLQKEDWRWWADITDLSTVNPHNLPIHFLRKTDHALDWVNRQWSTMNTGEQNQVFDTLLLKPDAISSRLLNQCSETLRGSRKQMAQDWLAFREEERTDIDRVSNNEDLINLLLILNINSHNGINVWDKLLRILFNDADKPIRLNTFFDFLEVNNYTEQLFESLSKNLAIHEIAFLNRMISDRCYFLPDGSGDKILKGNEKAGWVESLSPTYYSNLLCSVPASELENVYSLITRQNETRIKQTVIKQWENLKNFLLQWHKLPD